MIIVQHYLSLQTEGLTRIAEAPQISHWNGRVVAYITGYLLCVPLIGTIVWLVMRFFASLEQPIPTPPLPVPIPVVKTPPPIIERPLRPRPVVETPPSPVIERPTASPPAKLPVSPPLKPLPMVVSMPNPDLGPIKEGSDEDTSSDSTDCNSPIEATTSKVEVEKVEEKEPLLFQGASDLSDPPPATVQHERPSLDPSPEPHQNSPHLNGIAAVVAVPPLDLPKLDLPQPRQNSQHVNGVVASVAAPPPPPVPTQVLSYTETTQGVSFPFRMEIQKKADGFIVTKKSDKETRTTHYDLEWNILELSETSGQEWWKCKRTDKGIAFEGFKQKKVIKDTKACKRWLQEFHVAFQPFAKSKDKEIHFSILSEKDLSFANLFATKMGLEKINGKDALRLEIRLDNWALKHLWSGLMWVDPKTGFMMRKRMKDGVTAPVTVTDLTTVL